MVLEAVEIVATANRVDANPISTLSLGVICLLEAVFFLTSAISVVTGSTSLITVPALITAGIAPQTAIATNMFALTLMSCGATLPFLGQRKVDGQRLPVFIGLTIVSSGLGAFLLRLLPANTLSPFIATAMLVVAGLSLVLGDRGIRPLQPSPFVNRTGYFATFLLGIYGGLFSGGYVTLLTAVLVACFGHTLLEAIATSKAINIFSSLVATLVFMKLGFVDYGLGLLLGLIMFLGAFLGSRVVLRISDRWLRWLYLAAVLGLALRLLISTLRGA